MPDFQIKIKPLVQKAEKGKLPASLTPDYPPKLMAAFIPSPLLGELKQYASSDLDYELGGVLVGKIGKASRRMFVLISGFIPAHKGVSRRASFEFTNEAQQQIHEEKEQRFKDEKILGWFHTHPGYGIFLSSADQFIDENYFKEKYHVAVVIDPTRPGIEVGAFVWNTDHIRIRVPLIQLEL